MLGSGQSFAQNYVPNRDKLLDPLGKAGDSIGHIGRKLATAADDTDADDREISGGFTDVQRQI